MAGTVHYAQQEHAEERYI
ncbi:hypothetical protein CCU_27730 [Coprococcus sp. ART55/1]|nr:hypothetical protein CCU_27730 [Coprococcus sp. ART55/1]